MEWIRYLYKQNRRDTNNVSWCDRIILVFLLRFSKKRGVTKYLAVQLRKLTAHTTHSLNAAMYFLTEIQTFLPSGINLMELEMFYLH